MEKKRAWRERGGGGRGEVKEERLKKGKTCGNREKRQEKEVERRIMRMYGMRVKKKGDEEWRAKEEEEEEEASWRKSRWRRSFFLSFNSICTFVASYLRQMCFAYWSCADTFMDEYHLSLVLWAYNKRCVYVWVCACGWVNGCLAKWVPMSEDAQPKKGPNVPGYIRLY